MKVVVYAISKNESIHVDRWLDSMEEADEIYVTDTGSTDDTVDKLQARGVNVSYFIQETFDFGKARQASLDAVPLDADICICVDLDEVFDKGWRTHLLTQWDGADRGEYLFNTSFDEHGDVTGYFYNSKIHTRLNFEWRYPIHEWLYYIGHHPMKNVFLNGVVLNHYPDESKSRGNYLHMLQKAVIDYPNDDRMLAYLCREYHFHWLSPQVIETGKLCLEVSWWKQQRADVSSWIAVAYERLGDMGECKKWCYLSLSEMDDSKDSLQQIHGIADRQGWVKLKHLCEGW